MGFGFLALEVAGDQRVGLVRGDHFEQMPAERAECAGVVSVCQGQQVRLCVRGAVDHLGWECVDGGHDGGGLFGVDRPFGQGRLGRRMGLDVLGLAGPGGRPRCR